MQSCNAMKACGDTGDVAPRIHNHGTIWTCYFVIIRLYFLITRIAVFNFLFMFFLVLYACFLFCVFCVFVLFLLLYIAVSFLFLYKFTDHCHRVETQLQ